MSLIFTVEDMKSPERLERLFQQVRDEFINIPAPAPKLDINKLASQLGPLLKTKPQSAGVAPTIQSISGLEFGVYTPTLTNLTNLAASTAYRGPYARIGTTVIVGGRVDVDPTGAGQARLGISLPIPVSPFFALPSDCCGTGASPVVAGQCASISAFNDIALMEWIAVDTANRQMNYTFVYYAAP